MSYCTVSHDTNYYHGIDRLTSHLTFRVMSGPRVLGLGYTFFLDAHTI